MRLLFDCNRKTLYWEPPQANQGLQICPKCGAAILFLHSTLRALLLNRSACSSRMRRCPCQRSILEWSSRRRASNFAPNLFPAPNAFCPRSANLFLAAVASKVFNSMPGLHLRQLTKTASSHASKWPWPKEQKGLVNKQTTSQI